MALLLPQTLDNGVPCEYARIAVMTIFPGSSGSRVLLDWYVNAQARQDGANPVHREMVEFSEDDARTADPIALASVDAKNLVASTYEALSGLSRFDGSKDV